MSNDLPPSKFGAGYTYGGSPPAPAPAGRYGTAASSGESQPNPYAQNHSDPTSFASPLVNVAPQAPATYQPPASLYPAVNPYGTTTPPFYGAAAASSAPPRSSSGATAIIAAILGLLLAFYEGWQAYSYFHVVALFGKISSEYAQNLKGAQTYWVILAILSAGAALAYLLGAAALLNRNLAGRRWITLGSLAAIAAVVVSWVYVYIVLHQMMNWMSALTSALSPGASSNFASSFYRQEASSIVLAIALTVGIPLLTMILALAPATRRWCEARRVSFAGP